MELWSENLKLKKMHTDLYDNGSFLFNEILPKRGREIYFSSKNAHPNANAILSVQTKSEISMHPKQSSKQKERDIENIKHK